MGAEGVDMEADEKKRVEKRLLEVEGRGESVALQIKR